MQDFSLSSAITRRTVIAVITFAIVLTLPGSAVAQGLQWMHLVGPGTGWVASSASLFWTTDNGQHWKDITPDRPVGGGMICSVFFLDASTGWVLLSRYEEPEPQFDLAFTEDSGGSWSLAHLNIAVNPNEATLLTQGSIQFTDAVHGWMNLSLQSGAAFHSGLLFHTTNGGKVWAPSQGPGTAGDVRFIDQRNGWILSPDNTELWVTHDGSASWQQVVLVPPPQVRPVDEAIYDLPVFSDDKHGALTVSFSASPSDPAADLEGSKVALFATVDGGKTWKFDIVLAHVSLGASSDVAAAISDSTMISAQRAGNTLTLKQTHLNAPGTSTTASADIGFFGSVMALSFANDQQGWVMTTAGNCSPAFLPCTQLLSTVNAGTTWTDITPGGKRKSPVPSGKPIPLVWKRAGSAATVCDEPGPAKRDERA